MNPTPKPDSNLIMPEPETNTTPAPTTPPAQPAPVTNVPVTAQPTQPTTPATPAPEPEPDPLFNAIDEPDPIDPAPATVAPMPAPPVTNQVINKLDDNPKPVVVTTGQTVVAKSEPHKSRRRTMLMLVIGLLLLAGIGFAVYTYFMKPNVAKTETPAAILSVDKLSPENLTQATDKSELSAGAQSNSAVIVLSGEAPTDAPSGLSLEVEIQPLGTEFTGTPTEPSIAVASEDDPLKVTLTDYPAGSYHWQARLSDGAAEGPWTAYNTTDEAGKTADFTVDRTAPIAALIKTLNGRNVSTKTMSSTVAQPVFTGTAEAGSAITVALGADISYKATATAEGTWTLTASAVVPNARYTITVTSTDPAGNAIASTYTLTQNAR